MAQKVRTTAYGAIVPAGTREAVTVTYDFAVHGGAVGDITLTGDKIPTGALIVDSLINVQTVLTSGGAATVAVKVESAADVNAADAISGAPWSTAGWKHGDLDADTAPVLTTAEREVKITVGTAALTAGKFTVTVYYVRV